MIISDTNPAKIDQDIDEYLDYSVDLQYWLLNDSISSVVFTSTDSLIIIDQVVIGVDLKSVEYWLRSGAAGAFTMRLVTMAGRIKDITTQVIVSEH